MNYIVSKNKYGKLKQFLDPVEGILLFFLVLDLLDTPLLGHLDLLLGAVFPGFVPAGLVVGLPAFLFRVLLTELLWLRPTALVRNVNTALTRFVPARLNWRLLTLLDGLPPAFLDVLTLLVVRGVGGVRGGGVLHSGHLGRHLRSNLLAESLLKESLAEQVLTEQVQVEEVDATLLPTGLVTQSGHTSLGVLLALDLLRELQQLRGGNILQNLSQSLLINVVQRVLVIMFVMIISRPLSRRTGFHSGLGRLVLTMRGGLGRVVVLGGLVAVLQPLADLLVLLPALLHPLSAALLVVLSLALGRPLSLALLLVLGPALLPPLSGTLLLGFLLADLLICGGAVRLPHIFPLDLAVLGPLLRTLEQPLEGSLHQALRKEMSSFSESQKPQKRHYQQMSTVHLLSTTPM